MTGAALPAWAQQMMDNPPPKPKKHREAVIQFAANRLPADRLDDLHRYFDENTDGQIYIIRCHERVKIGFTNKLADRLRVLSTACPYPIELIATFAGNRNIEVFLHNAFEGLRRHGEWFESKGDVTALVNLLENTGVADEHT